MCMGRTISGTWHQTLLFSSPVIISHPHILLQFIYGRLKATDEGRWESHPSEDKVTARQREFCPGRAKFGAISLQFRWCNENDKVTDIEKFRLAVCRCSRSWNTRGTQQATAGLYMYYDKVAQSPGGNIYIFNFFIRGHAATVNCQTSRHEHGPDEFGRSRWRPVDDDHRLVISKLPLPRIIGCDIYGSYVWGAHMRKVRVALLLVDIFLRPPHRLDQE